MADPGGDNSWRTQVFRQKVITQIEECMRRAGNPTNKTSTEMENHVFQKAKSRDEYLGLVARVILHVREFNNQKSKLGGPMGPGGMPGPMPAGPGMQDPIVSLQNITKTCMQPAPGAGMPMGGQRAPFQTYHQPANNMMGPRPGMPSMANQPGMQPGPSPGPPSLQTSLPSPLSGQGPSPSPAGLVPSPSPQAPVDPAPRQTTGAPSPGAPLNTPGNPNSVGPSASPAPVNRTAEEQAYLDKWKQLQKYIEPLKRMINKISEEEGKEKEKNKMKNLFDILSDSSKRLPMATLLKCENVLEKLDLQSKSSTIASAMSSVAVSTATGKTESHMFQPLLNAVAQHIQSPTVNHTLYRTFGPAVNALHGPPIRVPSPPAKRLKRNDQSDEKISQVLIGEIARLDRRFKVKLDPLFHSGSKTVQLICQLDDLNLPTVPPLSVRIPEDYPETSPSCGASAEDYDCTGILQTTQKRLSNQLLTLPQRFSLTQMLDTWEMCVRQACAPRVKGIN